MCLLGACVALYPCIKAYLVLMGMKRPGKKPFSVKEYCSFKIDRRINAVVFGNTEAMVLDTEGGHAQAGGTAQPAQPPTATDVPAAEPQADATDGPAAADPAPAEP